VAMLTNSALQTTIGALNVLLFEEIEAGEIYGTIGKAIGYRGVGASMIMQSIRQDHDRNARVLREQIGRLGGDFISVAAPHHPVPFKAASEEITILAALEGIEARALGTATRILRMADADTRSLVRVPVISSLHRHLAEIERMTSRLRVTRSESTRMYDTA
jgi:hypothetical protein